SAVPVGEHRTVRRTAAAQRVAFQQLCQRRDDGNTRFPPARLSAVDEASPHSFADEELLIVPARPRQPTEFAMAKAGECSHSHYDPRAEGKHRQHLLHFLKRIGVGFPRLPPLRDGDTLHGVDAVEKTLPSRVSEHPAQYSLDV